MKVPLRVERVPDANRDTGEPAWRVIEADGWPVCLCWSEDYAKRIAAAPRVAVGAESDPVRGRAGEPVTPGG